MFNKQRVVTSETALKGRSTPIPVTEKHVVNDTDITAPVPKDHEEIVLGLGCFWGAERLFWPLEGVHSTSVGYSGGHTENPTYEEVCTGKTGHTEAVRIIFNPRIIKLSQLLNYFWEKHDPTQGMRQGNDLGSQYRSAIYTFNDEQFKIAKESEAQYQSALDEQQKGQITTEITAANIYYFAETYHQQYLARNPNGYCGLGGTGVCFPPNV
ncbi:peptide-methionine (S)-S-oxide reductase MsrA [Vibrio sp. DW001]|uniref:peptide-methionine (S)-S-oxide reductase MsrA n=1 Tax=Vibrio sp. DW001 TaxID=2912315 RepID=UPI0023B0881D|nr:peptide-methionine (S)-S-oxide reductase MsrA [Vibrio sp. DW001]WED26990.1 peptide-methionine (S)-S-oxide reductase MsrA [Vibrio sp. DW001]